MHKNAIYKLCNTHKTLILKKGVDFPGKEGYIVGVTRKKEKTKSVTHTLRSVLKGELA